MFHNLTQVDYRGFNPKGDPLNSGFVVPRQRWYVVGNVSQYFRYYTVINRGYGSLDLLDAFVDMNFGYIDREKFQIRVGIQDALYLRIHQDCGDRSHRARAFGVCEQFCRQSPGGRDGPWRPHRPAVGIRGRHLQRPAALVPGLRQQRELVYVHQYKAISKRRLRTVATDQHRRFLQLRR